MKPDLNEMTFRKITFSAALWLRYLTSRLSEFSVRSGVEENKYITPVCRVTCHMEIATRILAFAMG